MSRKKKTIIIIISIAAALLIAGTVVLAEFTRSSRAKRVAVTAGSTGAMFSSNYLGVGDIASNRSIIFSGSDEGPVMTVVTVCSYPQGNPTRYYDRPINYVLKAFLTDENGIPLNSLSNDYTGTITITLGEGQGAVSCVLGDGGASADTLSYEFTGRSLVTPAGSLQGARDSYSITFNRAAIEDEEVFLLLYTELEGTTNADPSMSSLYPDLKNLIGLFSADVAGMAERFTWQGYFNEEGALAQTVGATPRPNELDGFNYVVSGNGKGTIKLSWRNDMLQISEYFRLIGLGASTPPEIVTETGSDWSYIVFEVDSNLISRYDLQFYRANGASDSDFAEWLLNAEDLAALLAGEPVHGVLGYVTCEFTPEDTASGSSGEGGD